MLLCASHLLLTMPLSGRLVTEAGHEGLWMAAQLVPNLSHAAKMTLGRWVPQRLVPVIALRPRTLLFCAVYTRPAESKITI